MMDGELMARGMILALMTFVAAGCATKLTAQQEDVYHAFAVCRDKTGLPFQLTQGPDSDGIFRYAASPDHKGIIDGCLREQGLRFSGDPAYRGPSR